MGTTWFISLSFSTTPMAKMATLGMSTLLLFTGSLKLSHALDAVQWERQPEFRNHLKVAAVVGMLFLSLQCWNLQLLLPRQSVSDASHSESFVFVVVLLHAMHFLVAVFFLLWVLLNALNDRYDHEYYWGVTVCTFFWHALGVIWLVILTTLIISQLEL